MKKKKPSIKYIEEKQKKKKYIWIFIRTNQKKTSWSTSKKNNTKQSKLLWIPPTLWCLSWCKCLWQAENLQLHRTTELSRSRLNRLVAREAETTRLRRQAGYWLPSERNSEWHHLRNPRFGSRFYGFANSYWLGNVRLLLSVGQQWCYLPARFLPRYTRGDRGLCRGPLQSPSSGAPGGLQYPWLRLLPVDQSPWELCSRDTVKGRGGSNTCPGRCPGVQ